MTEGGCHVDGGGNVGEGVEVVCGVDGEGGRSELEVGEVGRKSGHGGEVESASEVGKINGEYFVGAL